MPILHLEMKAYQHKDVSLVQKMHQNSIINSREGLSVSVFLEAYALELEAAFVNRDGACFIELSNYYMPVIGMSVEEFFNRPMLEEDFLDAAASAHGFRTFADVPSIVFDGHFEEVVDIMLLGDTILLERELTNDSALVHMPSHLGHHAQLIHYCTSNAVEMYRQVVPHNLEAIVKLLLDFGADPSVKIPVYGGAFNFLELFTSSAHPYDAGTAREILSLFE